MNPQNGVDSPESGVGRKGAVVVGATAGVGRALAEELARNSYHLVLAARSRDDLEAVAADLRIRFGVGVVTIGLDLADPDLDPCQLTRFCLAHLDGLDAVFFPAGAMDAADQGPAPTELMERIVQINFLGVIRLISAFARVMEERSRGVIVTFSSIAADAPRGTNTVYSSAKAALDTYCQGLRHYLGKTSVRVQIYALGYVDTSMTFGKKLLFPAASPARVARYVVANLHRDRGRVYFPRFWALVVLALKLTPWRIYKRLSF